MIVRVGTDKLLKAYEAYEMHRGKPPFNDVKIDMCDFADQSSGSIYLSEKEFEVLRDYLM